jgi:predicted amidohydrolase YtcJ
MEARAEPPLRQSLDPGGQMSWTRRSFVRTSSGALVALSLAGCRSRDDAAPGDVVIFHNGIVLPVDAPFSQHAAMAIQGNRVLAVGDVNTVRSAAGSGAREVDLDGRTVLPGFIEPHMHFALMAGLGHLPDIGPFQQPTFDDALDAITEIREEAARVGPDEWVMGRQFDPILLEPPRDLTTRGLDPVVPDRPAFFLNASGHIAYVNSRLLAAAGIDRTVEDPPGGEYGRYADGELNGVLYGQSVWLPILLSNESVVARMSGGFAEAGIGVGEEAAALGITTLCDMATGGLSGAGELDLYRQMYAEGRMSARIRAYLYEPAGAAFDEAGVRPFDGDAFVKVAGFKVVSDGSNQGFTGRQRDPYVGTDNVGLFYVDPDALRAIVLDRAGRGWPMAVHGNGDGAIDSILDSMDAAAAAGIDVPALRMRIEHCSILHDDQIARMQEHGMVPSFLINHVHYWGHVMRDEVFGPEKVQLLDRSASVERAGLNWVFHSDAPVSPLGPLHMIRVAVARDLWAEPGTVLAPDERVSVEAAIRAQTINAAWAQHEEDDLGSLEPDKLADFVILEDDPRAVEPTAISDITVSETWMDGVRRYGGD